MLLASVTGPADREQSAATTAPLETNGIDASTTRAFAPHDIVGLHRELLVAHLADRHDIDQTERDGDVQ